MNKPNLKLLILAALFVSVVFISTVDSAITCDDNGICTGLGTKPISTVTPTSTIAIIGRASADLNAVIPAEVDISPEQVTPGSLDQYSIVILQGDRVCDRTARKTITDYVKSGGNLIVVEDACTGVSDDRASYGWDIGIGLLGDVVPVIGRSVTTDTPVGRKLRLVDSGHSIFNGVDSVWSFSTRTQITQRSKLDSDILAYFDIASGDGVNAEGQALIAIAELDIAGAGKTIYFAFDPASTKDNGELLLNTIAYLTLTANIQCDGFDSLECTSFKVDTDGTLTIVLKSISSTRMTNVASASAITTSCYPSSVAPSASTTCTVPTFRSGGQSGTSFEKTPIKISFIDSKSGVDHTETGFITGQYGSEMVPVAQPTTTIDALNPAANNASNTANTANAAPNNANTTSDSSIPYELIIGVLILILISAGYALTRFKRQLGTKPIMKPNMLRATPSKPVLVQSTPVADVVGNIDIRNLTIIAGGKKLIDNASLDVPAGTILGIIGPSGSGKSTILECLAGRRKQDSGNILIAGIDTYKQRQAANRLVGFVPQHAEVNLDQTVSENMHHSAIKWGLNTSNDAISRALDQMGSSLKGKEDVKAKSLSGGQLKLLSIAMELMRNPLILILDEPTSGLDPTSRSQIVSILTKQVSDHKKSVVFTSHFMDELEYCDDILVIRAGKIIARGSPEKLKRQLPGQGKLVSVTLERLDDSLLQQVMQLDGVKTAISEGRTMRILMDAPNPVKISQEVDRLGGIVEEAKIERTDLKVVFTYLTSNKN